jgi:peptidoglycan/xylan/chitin deacetylase (PgdA/CDA1 family)
MRLTAAAGTLVAVACVTVVGGVLAQRASLLPSSLSHFPFVNSAPVAEPPPTTVVTQGAGVVTQGTGSRNTAVAPPTAAAPATPVMTVAAASAAVPAAIPASAPAAPPPTCANPNGIGIARTVEVDTSGGPGFGGEHFKTHDFLRPGEVVLTFDDGPWPKNTPAVLAALAAHCTKALFFPIGKHAMWAPEVLRQVAAAGHSVGSHTWSHADLSKKSVQDAKDEIEKGVSAIRWAIGGPTAPFFRFPALKHPPELVTYLGERNIGIFSTDLDSFDFKIHKPDQLIQSVLLKLKKYGKGIVLMHDFQRGTAEAAMELLNQLKANGYKVVFMRAKQPVQTIASYDQAILKEEKLPTLTERPTSAVIRDVSE